MKLVRTKRVSSNAAGVDLTKIFAPDVTVFPGEDKFGTVFGSSVQGHHDHVGRCTGHVLSAAFYSPFLSEQVRSLASQVDHHLLLNT